MLVKRYTHNGAMGDIIYSLPTIISIGRGNLHLKHKNHYEFLEPLLLIQPYIDRIYHHRSENEKKHHIKLSNYRKLNKADPSKLLTKCHLDLFDLEFDLSRKWLFNIVGYPLAPIVVNYTSRYHDKEEIDWTILQDYKEKVIFIGGFNDHLKFRKKVGFPIEQTYCNTAHEMTEIIKGSKLFIGNQSLGFAIAEALKHPRVLEVFYGQNNCQPQSNNGHTYLTHELIENYL